MADRTDRMPPSVVTVIRDWLHETPASQCNGGSDTCGTWSLAEDMAEKIMASGELVTKKQADEAQRAVADVQLGDVAGRADRAERDLADCKKAMQLADDFLTIVQGGDIVRGEACKHHVREILRAALARLQQEER